MKKTTKFDAMRFLELLEDACVTASREDQQFVADPWQLGPRITSTLKALRVSSMYSEALMENLWSLGQSETDSKWRVYASGEPQEMLKGQEDGCESAEEALNHAIIHHELSAARRKLRNSSKNEER
jgi:hypothetical protein